MNNLKLIEIEGQKSFDGVSFPLAVSPSDDFVSTKTFLKSNLNEILEKLAQHGAILFR